MANKANKKALVRNQIITASNVYSNGLAGKMFLYVFGNEFFEVVFKTDRFMHLYAKVVDKKLKRGSIVV